MQDVGIYIKDCHTCRVLYILGLKKVSSSCPGQVDFLARQVESRQVVCKLNNKSTLRLVHGKQNLKATCPRGELEFKYLLSPEYPKLARSSFVLEPKGSYITFTFKVKAAFKLCWPTGWGLSAVSLT